MKPILLSWPGGEHEFALRIGELRAIQEKTDAGPQQLLQRMADGQWLIDDLVEIIRHGLIGGGMDGSSARKLVYKVFDLHPLLDLRPVSYAILGAALVGPEDDPVGEPQGATPPPENGSSANSTEQEPS